MSVSFIICRKKTKNDGNVKHKQLQVSCEKPTIQIPFNDFEVIPNREPKEFTNTGYKYAHTRSKSFRGVGFEAKDFAEKLGIVYLSLDNPNTKVINKVIHSLRPEPKPTGIKDYEIYTYNNGGGGSRTADSYLYDESLVERIRTELMQNSEKVKQNEFIYKEIKYRVL